MQTLAAKFNAGYRPVETNPEQGSNPMDQNWAGAFSNIPGVSGARPQSDGSYAVYRGTGNNRQRATAQIGPNGQVSLGGWVSDPPTSDAEMLRDGATLAAIAGGGLYAGGFLGGAGAAGAGIGAADAAAALGGAGEVGAGLSAAGTGAGIGVADAAAALGGAGQVGAAGTAGTAAGTSSMLSSVAKSLGLSTGDLVRGGLGLVDSLMGANASRRAANAQIGAAREGNALLERMYNQTRTDNLPALQARNNGLAGYQNLLKNPGSVTKDPGYQFGLNEGTKAVQGSAAARGGLYSGNTLKALTRYGNDYASTKFDNVLNRYGRLAGMGESGAGTVANAGSNYGNQASQNITSAGNARGAGIVGQYNALSNGFNNWQQGVDERAILRRYGFGG